MKHINVTRRRRKIAKQIKHNEKKPHTQNKANGNLKNTEEKNLIKRRQHRIRNMRRGKETK